MPLGVALALLVAGTCALWSPVRTQTGILRGQVDESLACRLANVSRADRITTMRMGGFGWQRSRLIVGKAGYESPPSGVQQMLAGWPLYCLEGWEVSDGARRSRTGLAPLPDWASVNRGGLSAIPLRPIWWSLIANSILLMLPLQSVLAYRAARRVWRDRRALCDSCGYNLRGQSSPQGRCPECGASKAPAGERTDRPRPAERARNDR